MIENAGAQKGFLVRVHQGDLMAEASVHFDPERSPYPAGGSHRGVQ